MYVFKVETINTEYVVESATIEEAKDKYDKIYESFEWLSISPIIFKEVE